MGGFEVIFLEIMEPSLRYHSSSVEILTVLHIISGDRTVSGGEFDWGGRLLKSNGGARWSPQPDWKPGVECIGIRGLDCETYKSSRCESRT